tara:strand:+ start:164 stop:676 length:513 start_codon:yes stop_codon:yes gene_type:complete
MKSKENIVFLGMMGSGKSSIGFLISKRLEMEFFDIDQCIENELDTKISKIFKEKGESYFRNIEEKITLQILKKKGIVVALGGGAFLNKNIRKEVIKNHFSIWLQVNSKTLIKRLRNTKNRPLALKATKEELIDLIKKRSNFYSRALYKVICNNKSKTQIINKVIDIYENK